MARRRLLVLDCAAARDTAVAEIAPTMKSRRLIRSPRLKTGQTDPSPAARDILSRLLIQLIVEMHLHRRPFAGDDAVDHGVAQRAVRRDLMVAQNAILFGTKPLDAAPALVVEKMRTEFDRDAVEFFERVGQ